MKRHLSLALLSLSLQATTMATVTWQTDGVSSLASQMQSDSNFFNNVLLDSSTGIAHQPFTFSGISFNYVSNLQPADLTISINDRLVFDYIGREAADPLVTLYSSTAGNPTQAVFPSLASPVNYSQVATWDGTGANTLNLSFTNSIEGNAVRPMSDPNYFAAYRADIPDSNSSTSRPAWLLFLDDRDTFYKDWNDGIILIQQQIIPEVSSVLFLLAATLPLVAWRWRFAFLKDALK